MTFAISGLRYSWPGAHSPTLSIDSLALSQGESLLLRGPSGSGKSTLLAALSGVIDVPAGSVKVAGQDMGALSSRQRDAFRGNHIGMIFQVFNLIPWLSARDNVLLPCRFSTRRKNTSGTDASAEANRLLDALKLGGHANAMASTLSVGQQQRVAAARALIGAPEIILADEPTSALDPETRDTFMALLSNEASRTGASLLVVSHDNGLETHFDRVLDMTELNRGGTA